MSEYKGTSGRGAGESRLDDFESLTVDEPETIPEERMETARHLTSVADLHHKVMNSTVSSTIAPTT